MHKCIKEVNIVVYKWKNIPLHKLRCSCGVDKNLKYEQIIDKIFGFLYTMIRIIYNRKRKEVFL